MSVFEGLNRYLNIEGYNYLPNNNVLGFHISDTLSHGNKNWKKSWIPGLRKGCISYQIRLKKYWNILARLKMGHWNRNISSFK
jgi:hypothetical protein